jgi:RNA polymerase sigma factor FliA
MTKTKAIFVDFIRTAPWRKEKALAGPISTRVFRGPPLTTTRSGLLAAKLARRDGLVLGNLHLAKTIALNMHKTLPVHVDLDDLVQAGAIGLFDAANKFDVARQDVFSRYAKYRIKGAILDSLRRLDWASRDMRRKHKQVEATKRNLASILQRAPTEAEVAEKLCIDVDRLRTMMLDSEIIGPISIDTRSNHGADLPALDLPSKPETQPDFICARNELRSMLGEAIKTLPVRYQKVVLLYYTQELTMKEIGGMLDVNESRVSQIHKSALKTMAIVLRNNGVDSIHAFQE